MIEAGVVIDKDGQPIHWHLPDGRSGGALPDSRELWDVLWENRDKISGFAHSHPGSGKPWPSDTDLSTFVAVENALGKSLNWWIATMDRLCLVKVNNIEYPDPGSEGGMYKQTSFSVMPQHVDHGWLKRLRMYTDWPADGVMMMECEDCGWLHVLRECEGSSADVYAAHVLAEHGME